MPRRPFANPIFWDVCSVYFRLYKRTKHMGSAASKSPSEFAATHKRIETIKAHPHHAENIPPNSNEMPGTQTEIRVVEEATHR